MGRILAPGWPDWIGTDGRHLGWVVRDRLFLAAAGDPEGEVHMVELPDDAEGVAVCGPDRDWVIALGQGFVRVAAAKAEVTAVVLDEEADPVGTRPGLDAGVFLEVPSHRVIALADGTETPLPDGASRSRWLAPWASGRGVAWVDGDVVYRMSFEGGTPRIAAVGRCPGTRELLAGPDGALVVRGRHGSLLVAARGLGVDGPPLEAARFRDTATVLATDEDGAFELALGDARVGTRWSGRLDPVGYIEAPGGSAPCVHDRETGDVRVLGEAQATGAAWRGFCGARPAVVRRADRAEIAGPGGRVWRVGGDAAESEALGLVDGVVAAGMTDGRRVIAHLDDELRVMVGTTLRFTRPAGDAEEVAIVEGTVQLPDGGFDLDGNPVAAAPPGPSRAPRRGARRVAVSTAGEDSFVRSGRRRWPVPAHAGVEVAGGAWAWSDEGALYDLAAPTTDGEG